MPLVLNSSSISGLAAVGGLSSPQTGSVLQVVQVVKTDAFSTTSTSFVDVTGMSASITPTSSSSKILVLFDIAIGAANGSSTIGKILRNSTDIYIGDTAGSRPRVAFQLDGGGGIQYTVLRTPIFYLDSPATTSSTTYKLQIYNTAGSAGTVNRVEQDRNTSSYNVRTASSITLMEIAA